MFSISFISFLISSDRGLLGVLSLGAIVIVLLTLLHGSGLHVIVVLYRRRMKKTVGPRWQPLLASYRLGWAVFLMLMLHVGEVILWASLLNGFGLVANFRDAIYFSANSYTTLGYGPMILPLTWRELSPIMAISGLFNFAYTTSALLSLMNNYWSGQVGQSSSVRSA
jgi:hypothetical protein